MSERDLKLQDPIFSDPDAARDYLEKLRWPDGKPVCPHCATHGRSTRIRGKSARPGLWKCGACRKQFTVTVGTIFHASHVGLNVWLLAFHLLCSSKKGFSALQLSRNLGVSLKTAWHMAHRIRFAMTEPAFTTQLTGTVEADETYVGGKRRRSNKAPTMPLDPKKPYKPFQTGRGADKTPVMVLVERGGQARSFRMANVTAESLGGAIRQHVARDAHLRTDAFKSYVKVGKEYASHKWVDHNLEYVFGDAHTNTAENYFSILKRGINGVYHHVSKEHLPRYLAEFDFRYNARHMTDTERTRLALSKTEGKRLMYRDSR